MSKSEVIEKMMNSENGGLYAAIGGIVLVYSIDRITKSHYKADVKKDSISLALQVKRKSRSPRVRKKTCK